jgi:hypothetical protein
MWYGACFGGGCLVGMVVMMFLLSGWVRQYTKVGTPSASHNSAMDAICAHHLPRAVCVWAGFGQCGKSACQFTPRKQHQ